MRIIYVHHAERDMTLGQNQDNDITLNGAKEAELLALKLKDTPVKAIYTAPYLRCVKTAKIISKYINTNIIEDDKFGEWLSGESKEEFLKRNMKAIDDIVLKYDKDDNIICVTSGVNLTAFICYFYGIDASNNVNSVQALSISPVVFSVNNDVF